jgi:hypothetical protein
VQGLALPEESVDLRGKRQAGESIKDGRVSRIHSLPLPINSSFTPVLATQKSSYHHICLPSYFKMATVVSQVVTSLTGSSPEVYDLVVVGSGFAVGWLVLLLRRQAELSHRAP